MYKMREAGRYNGTRDVLYIKIIPDDYPELMIIGYSPSGRI